MKLTGLAGLVVVALMLAACGEEVGTETTGTETTLERAPETTSVETTTTQAPTTTTTTIATTTTTTIDIESATIAALFREYFDSVAAKDYDTARTVSSGSATAYATLTEDLNAISTQPDWQLASESDPSSPDAVGLDDGRYGTDVALSYSADAGEFSVSNPVVVIGEGDPSLDEWGVDLGSGVDQPALGQRLKSIARSPGTDPSSCFPDGLWAYVPGGSDISTEVRIFAIGLACDVNGDLIAKGSESRLYTEDGALDVSASTFLLESGGDTVPVNTPLRYLAIFDIPREAASMELIWDTPFDRTNVPATTFLNFEIGPFDLS